MLQCSTLVGNLHYKLFLRAQTISTFLSGFCHILFLFAGVDF